MSRIHARRFGEVGVLLRERLSNGAASPVGNAYLELPAVVDDRVESFAADIQAAQTLLRHMKADARV